MDCNKVFEPYRNCHEGKSAVVFGTGPSLRLYKPPEDNLIKVGVNDIARYRSIKPDYYFFGHNPKNLYPSIKELNCIKFCCIFKDGKVELQHVRFNDAKQLGAECYEQTLYFNKLKGDITCSPLFNHSIIFSPVQFILFTGVKRVYLAGCDVGTKNITTPNKRLISFWKGFKQRYIDKFYPSVEFISINPVNLKIFKTLHTS